MGINQHKQNIKSAYTIKELFMTLGIISIVGIICIMNTIGKVQEQAFKEAYKTVFSAASQSWNQAVQNNLIQYRDYWTDDVSKVNNFKAFSSNFKLIKFCDASNNYECWEPTGEKIMQIYPDKSALSFIEYNGTAWSLITNSSQSGPDILVDTNGPKKPNQFGEDRFILWPVVMNGNIRDKGVPVKITTPYDYTTYNVAYCPSARKHPCYYRSWLYN